MNTFRGLEVQPVSHVTHYPSCYIDRTIVAGHKTVFGDAVFEVLGSRIGSDVWVPLTRETTEFDHAWAVKVELDRKIEQARTDEMRHRRERLV